MVESEPLGGCQRDATLPVLVRRLGECFKDKQLDTKKKMTARVVRGLPGCDQLAAGHRTRGVGWAGVSELWHRALDK